MRCPNQTEAPQMWVLRKALVPFKCSATTQFEYSLAQHYWLLIIVKLCKAAIVLQHSDCLSIDPDVSLVIVTYLWCQMMPGGFQRRLGGASTPALSWSTQGILYPSWTALSFPEAKSFFPGPGCPFVSITSAWTTPKSPVEFHYLITSQGTMGTHHICI